MLHCYPSQLFNEVRREDFFNKRTFHPCFIFALIFAMAFDKDFVKSEPLDSFLVYKNSIVLMSFYMSLFYYILSTSSSLHTLLFSSLRINVNFFVANLNKISLFFSSVEVCLKYIVNWKHFPPKE